MSEQKICPTCGTEYPLSERFCPRDGTALRSSNPQGDLIGTIVADRYHIMKKLGEGGMGTVYLAEHVKMGRKSALKVMNPGMNQDPDSIARFNREAANASRLSHPNICAIYDFGETPEGLIYLAMEFIEGQSLSDVVEKAGGGLSAPRAASIIHQAADALAVAHDAGIVHRDLKPDNIMISKGRDGSDVVKVVDFGIAKASSSDAQKVTKTGLVVGTPEYMSPEQLAGDKLDGRSDIYSLGLVAFNVLTGTLPFVSNSAQEAMIMRLTDHPRTLSEMRPDIEWPSELEAVMAKALARDADSRYQKAGAFGADMVKSVANMPATVAAAAGTLVIGAQNVPATRVAGPAAGGATKKIEVAPAPAAAPVAAPAAKSKTPMIAAVVGVLVLGAGGGYMALKPAAPAAPTTPAATDTSKGASNAKGADPAPVAGNPSVVSNPGGNGGKAAAVQNGSGKAVVKPITSTPAEAAAASTDPLMALVIKNQDIGSDAEAKAAISAIDGSIAKMSGETLGRAHYVKFMAYTQLNDTDHSCVEAKLGRDLLAPAASADDDKHARQWQLKGFVQEYCK